MKNKIMLDKKLKKKSLLLPVISSNNGTINLNQNYINLYRINSKSHSYNKICVQYNQKEMNKNNFTNNISNKYDQRILKNKNSKNKKSFKNKTYDKSKLYNFSAPEYEKK